MCEGPKKIRLISILSDYKMVDIMGEQTMLIYIKSVLENMPKDWLKLTTHRLDIYDEKLAKTQFLEGFEDLFKANNSVASALSELPTAYDYIRLGHPLSSIHEWYIARLNNLLPEQVINFSSRTIPIMSILRKNLLDDVATHIYYTTDLPAGFDAEVVRKVYGYNFELRQIDKISDIPAFDGTTVLISKTEGNGSIKLDGNIDFYIQLVPELGSVLVVNGEHNLKYISAIQHVRRRETIAMTPADTFVALHDLISDRITDSSREGLAANKASVLNDIRTITRTDTPAVVGSSGLSIQYAIVMGLIHEAMEKYVSKAIKIIVPPNCYGGTNDQARRVAACIDNVEVIDLPVDGDNDMVLSIDRILDTIAEQDAVPYIIAEIPTNPRVEVPDLNALQEVLSKRRMTTQGTVSIDPVFILDQTFCPNTPFLGETDILSGIRTISYVSGSKFPSGGRCTAGYCVANKQAKALMEKIAYHLKLCDNEATSLQYSILAEQLPSMTQRIHDAYVNTREMVNFINITLPEAKINFVSKELAQQGFTPSVFSLDLPTKGNTEDERESYKRALNLKLINLMITKIPDESKYCVSYGQLKGCYWTIPATSTQGTTKEGDKDYIARVALSPDMDLDLHMQVFKEFVDSLLIDNSF